MKCAPARKSSSGSDANSPIFGYATDFWLIQQTLSDLLLWSSVIKYFWRGCFAPLACCARRQLSTLSALVTPRPAGGSRYYNQRLCMSVCSSVARMSQKPHDQISRYFLYMLPVAMARSSSDDIAICYVLPVLWMTSCLHIIEGIGQSQRRHVCFVEFARWRHQSDVR